MKDIKVRQAKDDIKVINKSVVGLNKLKNNLANIKNTKDVTNDNSENVYESASSKLTTGTYYAKEKAIKLTEKTGAKAIKDTSKNITKTKNYIQMKKGGKSTPSSVKVSRTTLKQIKKINNVKRIASPLSNTSKIRYATSKAIMKTKKLGVNIYRSIKYALLGAKALLSALIAAGWVSVIVIVLICIIALFSSSIFGIFFSGSSSTESEKMISDVVASIDEEFLQKISQIQIDNEHDDYRLEVERASWQEVLSIYTTLVTQGDEAVTLDAEKEQTLRYIYWDMHTIDHEVIIEEVSEERIDDKGISDFVDVEKKILYIRVTTKTLDETMNDYGFTEIQKQEVQELLKDEYNHLWSSVIYGGSSSSSSMVEIAKSQLGNVGGQPYWSWYGYDYRVEWCATFVSWVANEAGYLEANIIPKFAGVIAGSDWFKMTGHWKEPGYIPGVGTIIFYDWEQDGVPDHVGIVEFVENNTIYTIEGNMDNAVKNLHYDINSDDIYGYGIPSYHE